MELVENSTRKVIIGNYGRRERVIHGEMDEEDINNLRILKHL